VTAQDLAQVEPEKTTDSDARVEPRKIVIVKHDQAKVTVIAQNSMPQLE